MSDVYPGHAMAVELRRDDYCATGAFAWISATHFESVAERVGTFLHPEEQKVFRALKVDKRRTSYILGRYTAKFALGDCIGPSFIPSQTLIASGIFSQSVVHGQTAYPLGVCISHSDRMICSIAYPEEHPMAVDVEEIDPARTKIMLTQIGEAEEGRARLVCGSIELAATVVWTAKEALSKALRCGMTCPFELLEICDLEQRDGFYAGQFKNFGQYKFQSWRRGDFVVTLVLPKKTELGISLPDPLS